MQGSNHAVGMLMVYLPKEKILFQGDFSVTPGQPANDHVKALVPALEKLNLDFDRYIKAEAKKFHAVIKAAGLEGTQ